MAKNSIESLLKNISPELNSGDFVFVSVETLDGINLNEVLAFFREKEAITLILNKAKADELGLSYEGVFSWITLNVFSSLDDVGLTAAFSKVLAENGISCNVMAGVNHDHIFVSKSDADFSMKVLSSLSS